jgi:hypothetical protein
MRGCSLDMMGGLTDVERISSSADRQGHSWAEHVLRVREGHGRSAKAFSLTLIDPETNPVRANIPYRTELAMSLNCASWEPLVLSTRVLCSFREEGVRKNENLPGSQSADGGKHTDRAETHKTKNSHLCPWRVVFHVSLALTRLGLG